MVRFYCNVLRTLKTSQRRLRAHTPLEVATEDWSDRKAPSPPSRLFSGKADRVILYSFSSRASCLHAGRLLFQNRKRFEQPTRRYLSASLPRAPFQRVDGFSTLRGQEVGSV